MTMTHEIWVGLSAQEREKLRDNSQLHPRLIGLEGKHVRVTPKREYGQSTFIVGVTTGWRPAHLAMRNRVARGSSDVINASEAFDSVNVVR